MLDRSKFESKSDLLLDRTESYPGLKKRRELDRKLLIWSYSAFKADYSYSLFKESKACWVRRIKSNRFCCFPFARIEPNTYGSEVTIDRLQVAKILDELYKIELQLFQTPNSIGIDGTVYGIEVRSYRLNYRLTWWETPREDWQPLLSWFEKTVEIFDSILPAKN